MLARVVLDRLGEDADMIAAIQAGDDDAIAVLVQEGRGEALIAAGTLALERIETDGMHRLYALLQSRFYCSQVGFHFSPKRFKFLQS